MTFQKQIKQILIDLAANDELPLDLNDLDESVFDSVKMSSDEHRDALKSMGYFTGNLWQLGDVQFKYECTDEEAYSVLESALENDATFSQIWEAIDCAAEDNGLKENNN